MQPTKLQVVRLIVFIVFSTIISCTTTNVKIEVTRPSEINLHGLKRIAIGEIQPSSDSIKHIQHAMYLADEISTALFNSGYYEVLDRNHINSILAEHKLALGGLVNENTAAEIGNFIGAAALLYGTVKEDTYQEKTTTGKYWIDGNLRGHQPRTREGVYHLSLTFKIIDTETAKILAVRTLSTSKDTSTYADNKPPMPIDSNKLFNDALRSITSDLIQLIAPRKETLNLVFQIDPTLPEVDQAVVYFRIGEVDEGIRILESAQLKPNLDKDTQAKIIYNLGVAEIIKSDYSKAIDFFKQAMLLNPNSSQYPYAISFTKGEITKASRLREQIGIIDPTNDK